MKDELITAKYVGLSGPTDDGQELECRDVTIKTEHAEMVGAVGDAFLMDDVEVSMPRVGLLIAACWLYDADNKGKGYGKELYRKALRKYGVLYSGWPVSEDAMFVHDALVRSGDVTITPFNQFGVRTLTATRKHEAARY